MHYNVNYARVQGGRMNISEINKTYNKTGSLRETAKICGVNWQKVRKILITSGAYESDLSIRINKLYNSGETCKSIANSLGISIATVNSYLPYIKCIYNIDSPSKNALRIKKCRHAYR